MVISSAFSVGFGVHFPTGNEPELEEALFVSSYFKT